MSDRLAAVRKSLPATGPEVAEYRVRMGGYLDAAITLIGIASSDAVENVERNPGDPATEKAIMLLAQAVGPLERLVALLCPMTAQPRFAVVKSEPEAPSDG
jgi:hypothetical protein